MMRMRLERSLQVSDAVLEKRDPSYDKQEETSEGASQAYIARASCHYPSNSCYQPRRERAEQTYSMTSLPEILEPQEISMNGV